MVCSCFPCRGTKKFDIDSLSYNVFRRFIELLQKEAYHRFALTSKANYVKCLQIRGIRVIVNKNSVNTGVISRDNGELMFCVQTTRDYLQFEQRYSKFWPYFHVFQLDIRFAGTGVDDEQVIPVDRTYRELYVMSLEGIPQIDLVADNYYHAGIEFIVVDFSVPDAEEEDGGRNYSKEINRIFDKMPAIGEYYFLLDSSREAVDALAPSIKIPSTASKVTIKYTSSMDVVDKIYTKGQWVDVFVK